MYSKNNTFICNCFFWLILFAQHGAFSQAYPQFGDQNKVTIVGLTHDAMEPFLSDDEQILFFNSLNSGGNTNLYYATRVNDTTFTYVGLVGNAYDPSPSHLDGVPSLDMDNRFFWVSLRDYPTIYENLLNSNYSTGSVSDIKHTYGDFNVYLPGWLIMDAAISYDGNFLYYVNAYFNSCPYGMPCEASLGVAEKINDTTFNKLPNTDGIFSLINDANYIVYAPQLSVDGKELYFTRIEDGTVNSEICVAVRNSPADTFSMPVVIYSNNGYVPEAATISNDKTKLYYHQKNSLGVFEIYMRYRIGTVGSADEKTQLTWSVFPNPARDVLTINTPEINFSVRLLNTTGEVLKSITNEKNIPVCDLAPGNYIVQITTEFSCDEKLITVVK